MTTIKQVAQHAGVSKATVSRVLNSHPKVDPILRDRVLASVAELNYQPSAVARSLRRQQTHTVGLLVPDNRNPFFAEIASGIEEYCSAAGYSVYLCNSADDDEREMEHCRNLYRQRVAGVIMAITGTSADGIQYLQNRGMALVLLDRSFPNIEADVVQSDHYLGAQQALEHLLGLGHRHFGFIIGSLRHPPVRDRMQACTDVLAQHGVKLNPDWIRETPDYAFESGYQGAEYLLSGASVPSAIFAFNDSLAIGALHYAREHGIDVPGDLSVVGVDNISLSSYVTPRLTTVAQPLNELGRKAADVLLNRVQGHATTRVHCVLTPALMIRDSTGPARTG